MLRSFSVPVVAVVLIALAAVSVPATAWSEAIIADHSAVGEFGIIPGSVIATIGSNYHVYYLHTSHGSQIMTGLVMLHDENGSYDKPDFYERADDLGLTGDTSWAPYTRTYLDANPDCDVAMFSWCAGVSDNTEEGIDIYLNKMAELEADYPAVRFVYMTGHLDSTGLEGNLYARNNQIRNFCTTNDKVLYDFADIESYDPDGNFYPVESDYCAWCYDWCATHTCPGCDICAHSHCFNCYLKGKAWWWMMARLTGWSSETPCCLGLTGNIDGDLEEVIDIGDLTALIGYLFVRSYPGLDCLPEANVDGGPDGIVDVGDLTALISYLFIEPNPLPAPCP
ncbi:MAG TPA: hypothetical protein VMY05_12670 [Acidobacteriota bacterium]|nr:hypothetical protein [Acidobacteriota bacterium]